MPLLDERGGAHVVQPSLLGMLVLSLWAAGESKLRGVFIYLEDRL